MYLSIIYRKLSILCYKYIYISYKLKMIRSSGKQNITPIGNETLDKFLGGGFLDSSLNIFERQGPSTRILEVIWNKSFAASTLARGDALIYLNFNSSVIVDENSLKISLPSARKVKSDLLYKDVRARSATAKMKIAWRYSETGTSSPTDDVSRVDQIDFGLPLAHDTESDHIGPLFIINILEETPLADVLKNVRQAISELKRDSYRVNILVKDILHPFSQLIDDNIRFRSFLYSLRCLSRSLEKGAILVSYDCDTCDDHSNVRQQLYNLADSVVSYYGYETGENKLTGYKDIDGTICYLKVPKINSFGYHFQLDLSDWGYRMTKNNRFFVVDELSLPPCENDSTTVDNVHNTTRWTNIESVKRPLEQVGPLEEFREVAKDVLSKKL